MLLFLWLLDNKENHKEYPHVAFVSALHGIELLQLKEKLLTLMKQIFIDQVAYVPDTEGHEVSYIWKLAEIVLKEYMYAGTDDNNEADPKVVAQLHF